MWLESINVIKFCTYVIGFSASITFDEEKITTFFGICLVLSQVFLSGKSL